MAVSLTWSNHSMMVSGEDPGSPSRGMVSGRKCMVPPLNSGRYNAVTCSSSRLRGVRDK
ncbi:hypothetical protein D9M71_815540 [compost metagenome]